MKRLALLVIGAIAFFGTAGCSHVQEYVEITQDKGVSAEYRKALEQWTRSEIIYSQFETRVQICATYRSPEFKRSYLKEYDRIYRLREGERKTREEQQAAANADATEFIFYAYIPEKVSNDFDRRSSIWSIFLLTKKGERIDPLEIRRIEPVTPVITEFFPYVNPYHGIPYMLRFPPLQKGGKPEEAAKLVFTSVIGNVTLDFTTW